MSYLLALDPGNVETGWVILNKENYQIVEKCKTNNENSDLKRLIRLYGITDVVIEGFKSYGMAIGQTVIDAIWWSGRFYEMFIGCSPFTLYRKDVKLNLCGMTNAKDKNITRALIDRFAQHDMLRGKGTKANPDVFYGFKADMWSAMALGVTYIDIQKGLYKLKGE